MSTTHPTDVVEAYIEAVRARLADVPEEDRVELLDDVAGHVREIADEFGPAELEARLGTPANFTEELRVSAGYGPVDAAAPAAARESRVRRWLDEHLRTDASKALWRRLEPGWLVVRGALAGYVVASALRAPGVIGAGAVVAGAVASFKLGERRPPEQAKWLRRTRIATEAVIVVLALGFVNYASHTNYRYIDDGAQGFQYDPCLRDSAGRAIGNLYGFDPSGQPIAQFFLTDQNGRPIDNLCPDQAPSKGGPVQTEYAHDANGNPVYGVFPRKQGETNINSTDNGVTMTTTPIPPPAVVFPQLAPSTTEPPPQP